RNDANNLGRSRRQFQANGIAGAAQQYRSQVLAQLLEILVSQHLSLLIDDAVLVKEAESWSEPSLVNELHHRVQVFQAILERRAGKNQREGGAQPLDHASCLRFPVFDPLSFIENDQVPLHLLDVENVAQDLFVVADREEAVLSVLLAAMGGGAGDELRIA